MITITIKKCKVCHKKFVIPTANLKFRPGLYCSSKCYSVAKRGKNNPNWRGGKINRKGYLYAYCPSHPHATKSNYVLKHHLIMEKKIGRYLVKGEVVHHINGDIMDNRVKNLIILTNSQHSSMHHKGKKQSLQHINDRMISRKNGAGWKPIKRNKKGQFCKTKKTS